eukprot:573615-Pelagomonas_calceolata.AAC.1
MSGSIDCKGYTRLLRLTPSTHVCAERTSVAGNAQMVARDNSASSGGTGIGPQISIGEAGSSHTSSSGRTNLPFDSQGFVAWHERVNK